MNSPYLSIIIPCFNQGRFLGEATESCLAQGDGIEIIIVNDGSVDCTSAVANSFGSRVTLITTPNSGRSKARNTGARRARGEYVLFLDADDRLEVGMAKAYRNATLSFPNADVYYGGWLDMDQDGRFMGRNPCAALEPDSFHALLENNAIVIHAGMVRRAAFVTSGLFDTTLHSHEDWDLWLRLAAGGARFARVDGEHVSYRRYQGSSSSNRALMSETQYQVIRRFSAIHRRCPHCRRILSKTLPWMRWHYLRDNVIPLIDAPPSGLNRLRALSPAIARCFNDPALGLLFFKTMGGRARRRVLGGS